VHVAKRAVSMHFFVAIHASGMRFQTRKNPCSTNWSRLYWKRNFYTGENV